MRVATLFTAIGLLSSFVLATPQTPQQSADVKKQLEDYLKAIITDPAVGSAISAVATDSAALKSVQEWQASITAAAKQSAVPSDYLNGLPSGLRSVFASVASAENDILTKNGFSNILPTATAATTEGAAPTSTSSKAAAVETGVGRMGIMAGVGAVLGLAVL
ncbi:hypothetical protein HYFRA_00010455 [Hymenoscyphus fraxineus]|uniref:Uncharacterized protein n=1 Tax=Hymenoscyphus fraxineus TaxID=746836 RepID=A0A9N9PKW3_9HELO|nr:hypothetical protein HYFRA_00010455 [Hymenoscyphus fraxineus]